VISQDSRALPIVILAFCCLAAFAGCERAPENELWVIGLDGADWDILEPLMAQGELPNLARLRREGAWGALQSDEPMLSPILWTSIATGKTADLHGVTWFMSDGPNGEKIPVSSHNRWVRALWNIASESKLRSTVIGWWATWPADPIEGYILSDYIGWHSFGVTGRTLEAAGKTHPATLQAEVQPLFPDPSSIPMETLQKMVHLPPAELSSDTSASPFGNPIAHLRQALSTTVGYTQSALHLLEKERSELFMIYFEGTDAVEHLFGSHAAPRLPWIDEADFAAYRDVVVEYWKWQDLRLGELLARRNPSTNILVVSDHGFRTGAERLKEEHFSIDRADASHLPDGIVVLNGPAVATSARLRGATIYDVAPTALHLLGLGVPDDFEGRVLVEGLSAAYMEAHPIQRVPSYEVGAFARAPLDFGAGVDGEAMEEMLRSLGYISGGPDGTNAVSGSVEQAVNLAVVLRRRNKYEEAKSTLERVLELAPGHVEARSNLARVHAEMGNLPEAETMYRALLEERPQELAHYDDLALALGRQDKTGEALEIYERGLARFEGWAGGFAGRGFALHLLGRDEEALAALDRAVELDPRDAASHYYRGAVLAELDRLDEARAELQRALELAPGHAPAILRLNELAGGSADPAANLVALEQAYQINGEDPDLKAALGAAYLRLERIPEALPLLRDAAERLPDDALTQGNAGMAYAMSGDLRSAARQFERVLELEPGSREAIGTLGQIYLRSGQPERAEELLERSVELAPGDPRARYALGEFYHQTGQIDAALQQYEEASRLDPTVGAYIYQQAMIHGQRGDEAKARQLVAQARSLDPTLPAVPER
jgi:tetratricopeptide (TPR) repeat protein